MGVGEGSVVSKPLFEICISIVVISKHSDRTNNVCNKRFRLIVLYRVGVVL